MAITWGPYEQGSDGNGLRAGIELSVTDTDNITAKYYVGNEYDKNDTETSTRTGFITGSTSFTNSGGDGSTVLITTVVKDGAPGNTYTLGHSISGVYNGATPSVSASITIAGVPDAPPWVSGTPTDITQTSAFFDWTAPDDNGASIDAYQITVDNNSDFTSLVYNNTNAGGSETVTGLTMNTTYYARVRAHNSKGWGPWASTRSFKTDPGVPGQVGTPSAGSITSTTATLTWSAPANNGSGITGYDVQVDDSSGFGSPFWNKVSPDVSEGITGMTRAKTYYARVRAKNAVGVGAWSGTRTFTTLPTVPSAPLNVSVSNVGPTTATVSWAAPSDNGGATVTAYDVEYSTSSSFTGDAVSQANGALKNLTPGRLYYTRVRAKNASGNGPWSTVVTFTTTTGIKVYTGTAWADSPVYVNDGANLDASEVLVYTGTAWVPAG